jgi:hypothetical protein
LLRLLLLLLTLSWFLRQVWLPLLLPLLLLIPLLPAG